MNRDISRSERGQDLVEYAIIIPIFLMFLMFIADFGRVIFYMSMLQGAAREGARLAIIDPDDTAGIQARVQNFSGGMDPADLTITSGPVGDDHWQVTAAYRFRPITPFIGGLLGLGAGDSVTISSRSRMRLER